MGILWENLISRIYFLSGISRKQVSSKDTLQASERSKLPLPLPRQELRGGDSCWGRAGGKSPLRCWYSWVVLKLSGGGDKLAESITV